MDTQKQELITKLKEANNVLVTVSANPSIDQLAACIGLTLLLNKMKKHATAVFSGQVPSTLDFLKPEETLEKNTDSLRDFIVSLDKAKADKLRYKVEDNVVKIFITPYKTSITEADLDFSQGDFNIDVVVCLGVDKQADLDQAITSHGRILHDATVAAVSINGGELGTVNWVEPHASSLSELAAQIADAIGREHIDGQIATSFLTGIVAETARFSNEKTSPVTMQLSAQLMAAGANQQLVASELETKAQLAISTPAEAPDVTKANDDGTLEIGHTPENPDTDGQPAVPSDDRPEPSDDSDEQGSDASQSNEADELVTEATDPSQVPASRLILQPPSMSGTMTANTTPEYLDPGVDPLTLLNRDTPMLTHNSTAVPEAAPAPAAPDDEPELPSIDLPAVPPVEELPASPAVDPLPDFEPLSSEPVAAYQPEPTAVDETPIDTSAPAHEQSLAELEQAVDSPHLHADDAADAPVEPASNPEPSLDAARDAVMDAMNSGPTNTLPQPTQASGAGGYLNVQDIVAADETTDTPIESTALGAPVAPEFSVPTADPTPPTSVATDPSAAPPVPPPLPLDDLSKFTTPK